VALPLFDSKTKRKSDLLKNLLDEFRSLGIKTLAVGKSQVSSRLLHFLQVLRRQCPGILNLISRAREILAVSPSPMQTLLVINRGDVVVTLGVNEAPVMGKTFYDVTILADVDSELGARILAFLKSLGIKVDTNRIRSLAITIPLEMYDNNVLVPHTPGAGIILLPLAKDQLLDYLRSGAGENLRLILSGAGRISLTAEQLAKLNKLVREYDENLAELLALGTSGWVG